MLVRQFRIVERHPRIQDIDRLMTHRYPLTDSSTTVEVADQKLQTGAVKTVLLPFAAPCRSEPWTAAHANWLCCGNSCVSDVAQTDDSRRAQTQNMRLYQSHKGTGGTVSLTCWSGGPTLTEVAS